jgi:hypothetical protein
MTYDELVIMVNDYCENSFPTVDMNIFIRQAEQRIYNTVQLANLRKNVTGTLSFGNPYLSCPDDFLSAYSLAVYPIFGGDYKYLLNKDVNFMREAYPNPNTSGTPKHYAIFGPQSNNVNELSFMVGPTPDAGYGAELHYYYYPESIVQGALKTLGVVSGGSGYVNGSYFDVPLTGGTGNSATANIVVSSNAVSSVVINNPGCKYVVGDSLSALNTNIGGTGSSFAVPVTVIANATGTTWLGDNFDSALLYGTMCEALVYMKGEPDMIKLYQDRYVQAIALLKNLGDGKQRADAYRDGQVRVTVA